MSIRDSEYEPNSIKLKHLASRISQSTAFFDKRKVVPFLGYQLGFRHKVALYDRGVALDGSGLDNNPSDICYDPDRNKILITLQTTPGRLLIMDPEDMSYSRLILTGTNAGAYRVVYDGEWYWVATFDPNFVQIVRINPDTLDFSILDLPNDGYHTYAYSMCVAENAAGKRYVFVGLLEDVTWNSGRIVRITPNEFPAYDEVDIGSSPDGNVYATAALVFDGTYVWAGSNNGRITRINPETLSWTRVTTFGTEVCGGDDIVSGCFDGSYVWFGAGNGQISKFNPSTYNHIDFGLEGSALIWGMCFDGRYIHITDHTNGYYYILHPETLEYNIHQFSDAAMRSVIFDGMYIWIIREVGSGVANAVIRLLVHEPSRRFEHGQTDTFAIDATGNISIAVTFRQPFIRTPTVVVSLNDVTDQSARIVNVEAQNVTTTGFNARCRVDVAGAAGSTARFMWMATERSTHHP